MPAPSALATNCGSKAAHAVARHFDLDRAKIPLAASGWPPLRLLPLLWRDHGVLLIAQICGQFGGQPLVPIWPW